MDKDKQSYNKEEMLRNLALETQEENEKLREIALQQNAVIIELQERLDKYQEGPGKEIENLYALKEEYESKIKELNEVIQKYKTICNEMKLQHSKFRKNGNEVMKTLQGLIRRKSNVNRE